MQSNDHASYPRLDSQSRRSLRERLLVLATVLLVTVALDQGTKAIARSVLLGALPRWLLGGIVCLEYAENPGAFMSMGASLPPSVRLVLWVGLVTVLLAVAVGFVIRARDLGRWQVVSLAFVIAGGVGNLIDRLFNEGAVIDWVSFGVGRLRTGVLNIADVAVTGGCLLFVILALRRERDDGRS